MAQAVAGHNSKLMREDRPLVEQPGCNCRGGLQTCPVGGKCHTSCVVYKATVTETQSGNKETYTGVTSRTFKKSAIPHMVSLLNKDALKNKKMMNFVEK